MVIGEAASKVSRVFKEQHIEVPWAKLTQLRNFYIHSYHSVDAQKLWQTVQSIIRDVERKIQPLVPQESSDE
jgi:uncharacterized protein with HEPN domain